MSFEQSADLDEVAASVCHAEHLVLKRLLGGGTYKQAFLAEDGERAQFALKIVRDPNPSKRVLREVDSLRRCDHPCIAKFFKLGSHRFGSHHFQFLIEEYLPGGSLSQKLASGQEFSDRDIVSLAVRLTDALAHLAGLGFVHRDIKPDNIVFRADGLTPVLIDFGCVRDLAASSLTQTWLQRGPGTPYFASPEQLNNQKPLIDWRADQFSLGVTLYFARFRNHPYQHPDEAPYAEETVHRVAERGERSAAAQRNLSSPAISPLLRMTAPWPAQRFRIPTDLIAAWAAM